MIAAGRGIAGRLLRAAPALGAAMISGCAGAQSALDPAGPQSARIGRLFWLYFGVDSAAYVAVGIVLVAGLLGRSRRRRTVPVLSPRADLERRLARWVTGSVVAVAVLLFVLLLGDYTTGRAIRRQGEDSDLTIKVTGHQWWWGVQYQDPTPSRIVATANEMHIPVGRTVELDLQSTDVIHSFWVPNLHGKMDLIPGYPTRTFLRADRAGTYRGQCAEFCGFQHAFMRLVVVAEPEDDFDRWLEAQRRIPPEPTDPRLRRGRDAFLGTTCVMCHTIQGRMARASVGPDLTHIASRPLIGGVLPNTRGNLAGWVVDPQRIKPGVRMPMNPIRPDDLDPLLDYLESLK
jgi:cytochrome c oxidase subunit 2